MQATLYPVYGPVWYAPRRHFVVLAETLPSGEKIEKMQEVTDANAPYDYSEEDANTIGEPESDTESDSGSSEDGAAERASLKSESAFPTGSVAAPAVVAASGESSMVPTAAAMEAKRLKALHAQVRADPRSALGLLTPEQIACDTCGGATGEDSGSGSGGEESESEGSESNGDSSEEKKSEPAKGDADQQLIGPHMCDRCKKKKKKHCRHVVKKVVVVHCQKKCKKPCNHKTNTPPIVDGKCPKKKCDKEDIEVTKTYQAWASSMSPFAPVAALDTSAATTTTTAKCEKQLTVDKAINASIIKAEALIKDFASKGGLKIDEKKEIKTLNELTIAIGKRLPFEGSFDHAYVCSPVGVASIGRVVPEKHVQTLTIGVRGEPRTNAKTGEAAYYLSLAVKPGTAPKSDEVKIDDVFRIKVADKKMVTEVIQKNFLALQAAISATPTKETVTKIGSLLQRVS